MPCRARRFAPRTLALRARPFRRTVARAVPRLLARFFTVRFFAARDLRVVLFARALLRALLTRALLRVLFARALLRALFARVRFGVGRGLAERGCLACDVSPATAWLATTL